MKELCNYLSQPDKVRSVEYINFSGERVLFCQKGEKRTAKILDIKDKMAGIRIE